jgi:hypothetical protein
MNRLFFRLTTPLSSEALHRKRYQFAIAMLPLVGSVLLNWGLSVPFLDCPLLRYLGIPCPAWGLTRSFQAIARGEWSQAMAFHGLGWVFFAGFAIASIHFGIEWYYQRQLYTFYLPLIQNSNVQLGSFVMLWVYHGGRLCRLAQNGELAVSLSQAPMGHFLLKIFHGW